MKQWYAKVENISEVGAQEITRVIKAETKEDAVKMLEEEDTQYVLSIHQDFRTK